MCDRTIHTSERRSMTVDEATVHTMLHGTKADLTRLRREVDIAIGELCPECGGGDIEDNGLRGRELEYRCCDCDHRWEAAECTITLCARR